MKLKSKAIISVFLAATLLTANPALAASGGRISGGSFRSSSGSSRSPSSYSSPSRSYSRPSSSYSYTRPSAPYIPPPPVYVEPRRPSNNIIIIPDIAPPAPVYVNPPAPAPITPTTPTSVPTSVQTLQTTGPSSGNSSFPLALLIILCLSGVVTVLSMNRSDNPRSDGSEGYVSTGKLSLARVQVALLASAQDLKDDLERMAGEGDTDSNEGLAKILQDTTLAILRHPDKAVYAFGETCEGNPEKVESLYNNFSMEERSKVSDEIISNVSGRVSNHLTKGLVSDGSGEYILVSILVAVEGSLNLKPIQVMGNLHKNLVSLGSVSPNDLVAMEIIWQPEGEREVLTQEELLALYPNLNRL